MTIYDYVITLCGDISDVPHGEDLAYLTSCALLLFIYFFIYWIMARVFSGRR